MTQNQLDVFIATYETGATAKMLNEPKAYADWAGRFLLALKRIKERWGEHGVALFDAFCKDFNALVAEVGLTPASCQIRKQYGGVA